MKHKEQEHDTIFVRFHTRTNLQKPAEEYSTASRNGNNAAWLCVCGYRLPLIWSGLNPKNHTACPECGRCYGGVLRGNKPTEIVEEKR